MTRHSIRAIAQDGERRLEQLFRRAWPTEVRNRRTGEGVIEEDLDLFAMSPGRVRAGLYSARISPSRSAGASRRLLL